MKRRQLAHPTSHCSTLAGKQTPHLHPLTLISGGFKKTKDVSVLNHSSRQDTTTNNKNNSNSKNSNESNWKMGSEHCRKIKTQCDDLDDEKNHQEQQDPIHLGHSEDHQDSERLVNQLHQLLQYRDIEQSMSPELTERVERVLQAANSKLLASRKPLSEIENMNSEDTGNMSDNPGRKIKTEVVLPTQPSEVANGKSKNLKTSNSEQQIEVGLFNADDDENLWNFNIGNPSQKQSKNPSKHATRQIKIKEVFEEVKPVHSKPKNKRVLSYAVSSGSLEPNEYSKEKRFMANGTAKQSNKKSTKNLQPLARSSSKCQRLKTLSVEGTQNISKEKEKKKKVEAQVVDMKGVNSIRPKGFDFKCLQTGSSLGKESKDRIQHSKSNGKLKSGISTSKLRTLENTCKLNIQNYIEANKKAQKNKEKQIEIEIEGEQQQLFSIPLADPKQLQNSLPSEAENLTDPTQFLVMIQHRQVTKQAQLQQLQTQIRFLKSQINSEKQAQEQRTLAISQLQLEATNAEKSITSLQGRKKTLHKNLEEIWSEVKKLNAEVEEDRKQNDSVVEMIKQERELIEMYNTVLEEIRVQLRAEVESRDEYRKLLLKSKKEENVSKMKQHSRKQKNQVMMTSVRESIGKWVN